MILNIRIHGFRRWTTICIALEHARELNVSNALLHTDSKLIEDSVNQGYVKMRVSNHF